MTFIAFGNTPPAKEPGRINILDYGVSAAAADNATALQAAIDAAISSGLPLYIPSAGGTSGYKYTAPLRITGNITIFGDYVGGNWNNGINVPRGTPALLGSVLRPSSNGSNAIDITGTSLVVNMSNIGILFQTLFTGTGHGINYAATLTQGLSGSNWNNVMVFGHDGDHYAFRLFNFIYNTFNHIQSFGGGGAYLTGNGVSGNYGNSTFFTPNFQVLAGGTADALNMSSTSINNLNLLYFASMQTAIINEPGITPVSAVPTTAQYQVRSDTNLVGIRMLQPICGGNIANTIVQIYAGNQNVFDFQASNIACIIRSPAWTTLGIATPGGNSISFTDTTSTGTVANIAGSAMPRVTVNAANAITATNLSTLYLPAPVAGTNVTATSTQSLHTAGQIVCESAITAQGGGFFSGGAFQVNRTGSSAIQIGDSTNTTTIAIGNASGLVTLGGTSALATNATKGFPIIPTMAGVPTGSVTAGAIVYDTTNHKFWISEGGGTWKSVLLA